ncbi:hypothetical protein RFI_05003 [Reticulomyxa filosa]|uniref:Uncharacterized protein n=1 Tax=Reticulomyxa filosa TaxID=46433 RepID=X6P220_RETFI|nr:hypothetical protein RFI_05003 [Reticulomyxa filosa]|eukprot:ETO32114.1 hypothetical protein RFI_05003 [Reticulomyxa filosa]
MLAKLGRGFSDVVVYRERIYSKIDHLMRLASVPVLTDIEVGFIANDIEVYPFPVPDLFVHSPVVIAARYNTQNKPPKNVIIKGFEPSGEQKEFVAPVLETPHLPVDKIFVKEKIDLLTAQAWFSDDKKIENQVIQESVTHSIPSQYTSLIAFETRQEDLERRGLLSDQDQDQEKEEEEKTDTIVKSKKWAIVLNNKATVGALAIGGTAIAIAATAATFGDVQATFDNIPVLDGGFGLDLLCVGTFFFFFFFFRMQGCSGGFTSFYCLSHAHKKKKKKM